MTKLSGKMLAQLCGYGRLYDAAVQDEQKGNEIAEGYKMQFRRNYGRLNECFSRNIRSRK